MNTIKVNDLKKAGKELNKILFEEDAPQIDIKASEEVLKEQIKEAAKLLTKDDILSDLCKEVVEALAPPKAKATTKAPAEKVAPVKQAKKVEKAEPTLEAEIMGFDDITDLKRLVKADDTFASLRKSIGLEKNVEKLRDKMLALIIVVDEDEKPSKKATPKAPVEKAEKESKPAAKKEPKEKKEKAVTAISIIQTAVCTKFNITNEQIIAKLVKAGFENTNERYVDMRRKEALMIINILISLEKVEA